jgi:hypothetical protein
MVMRKITELSEMAIDELELVSGGAAGIGIGYGVSSDGKNSSITWPDGTGQGYYTMSSGQNGVLWTHN